MDYLLENFWSNTKPLQQDDNCKRPNFLAIREW
jgi:hypothetical protein